ncbi:hypothetical protein Thal_1147 [Thermocrinis albus DSM 14484]|uniref:Uncharacterized protein n=1 Tax=Thermocrinis albus (strain DSM 14484 / JCM 11386 / HI 11/12) TaxID=638303 RepID=D3SLZ9_THEAH|nr:hypothetical protein [Thermocrinis albus]ADC89779.1 hypothetical protein Thal_1147 [Thermocrinis albus DSM 14484]
MGRSKERRSAMKTIFLSLILLMGVVSISVAGDWGNMRPYKDIWGNSYKYPENLYKDTDGDGVINMYDYNDRNPRIQTPYQYDPYRYDYGPRRYYKRGW